jgi:hypothetical protein
VEYGGTGSATLRILRNKPTVASGGAKRMEGGARRSEDGRIESAAV